MGTFAVKGPGSFRQVSCILSLPHKTPESGVSCVCGAPKKFLSNGRLLHGSGNPVVFINLLTATQRISTQPKTNQHVIQKSDWT